MTTEPQTDLRSLLTALDPLDQAALQATLDEIGEARPHAATLAADDYLAAQTALTTLRRVLTTWQQQTARATLTPREQHARDALDCLDRALRDIALLSGNSATLTARSPTAAQSVLAVPAVASTSDRCCESP